MSMRYIGGLSEEAMTFLGVEPSDYVNEAVQEKLDAEVRERGYASVSDFVEEMRKLVRVNNGGNSEVKS
jgi:hypothetical protein